MKTGEWTCLNFGYWIQLDSAGGPKWLLQAGRGGKVGSAEGGRGDASSGRRTCIGSDADYDALDAAGWLTYQWPLGAWILAGPGMEASIRMVESENIC